MVEYGKIYIITNLINGMKYVGKTTKTLEQRFRKHCQDSVSSCRKRKAYLNNALNKNDTVGKWAKRHNLA